MNAVQFSAKAGYTEVSLTYDYCSQSSYYGSQSPANLFNNSYGTHNKYCSDFGSTIYVQFHSETASVVSRMDLCTADDGGSYPGRDWKNFELQGYAGDNTWVTIKSWSNCYPTAGNRVWTAYVFTNNTAFFTYRIKISAIRSGSIQQMAKLKLYTNDSRAQATIDCNHWELVRAQLKVRNNVRITANMTTDGKQAYLDGGTASFNLNGYTVYAQNSNSRERILSAWGSNLTVTGSGTFDGQNTKCKWSGSCMVAESTGACLNLNGTFTIKNFKNDNNGGGVWVESGSTLNVNGCTINNCTASKGAGIYTRGTTKLNSGTISSNTASSQGGGIYQENGTVNLEGGTISSNSVSNSGNGGGVYILSGTLSLKGSTIYGNTAANGGGIYSLGKTYIKSGTISNGTATYGGGGIYVESGTLSLEGGTISGNTAQYGGGVRCIGGTATLSGTAITGNHSYGNGSGIQLSGNPSLTFNMTGGTISNNTDVTACTHGGGGILAWTGVTLNISGGTISGNTTSGCGGGIHIGSSAAVTITGGSITGNKSGGAGSSVSSTERAASGGVFYNSSNALTLGGTTRITGNTNTSGTTSSNVLLNAGKIITVSTGTPLANGASIGVTTHPEATPSKAVTFIGVRPESDSTYFFSDDTKYIRRFNEEKKFELCGYLLTLDADGGTCGVNQLRTVKGYAYPTLPVPTRIGMYSPGWYTEKQNGSKTPDPGKKATSSTTVDYSTEKTIYAWWLDKFTETKEDDFGSTERIVAQQVSTDDVIYALDKTTGDRLAVVDMTKATSVTKPSEIVDVIRNNPKTTPNTLIFFPNGVNVPQDRSQNVVIRQVSGKDTTFACVDFSVTDGYSVKVDKTFKADAATYNRSMSGRWGTVCVPYELKSDERVQFYTSGTIKGDLLVLEKSATVPAGHGAIYQVRDIDAEGEQGETLGKKDFAKTDLVKVVENTQTAPTAAVKVQGQFTELKVDDAKAAGEFSGYDLYYYKDNKFYKRTAGQTVTIPALRAYILISKAAPSSLKTKSLYPKVK